MLSLSQAFRNAIEAERASERFYGQLTLNTTDRLARKLLTVMARQEASHANELETMAKLVLEGKLPVRADVNVDVIEMLPDFRGTSDLSFNAAVRLALTSEQSAVLYYDALAEGTSGAVALLFQSLVATEKQHAANLARLSRNVGA